jgi:calcium/proton exchanger
MSSLMIVASASLIIPSALYSTLPQSNSTEPDIHILALSYITSIILLAFYLVYLYFQLKSHARLFEAEEEEGHDLGPVAASIVLIMATVGVMVCSDSLIDSIDGIVEASHVSRTFIGLIIVPIVGNAGEYATTVKAALKGKLDLAIAVVVGSTLQIALFVTPFLVILGWIIGQPMELRFDTIETTVFFLAVVVVNCLIRDGRTNYFEGALLIGT